MKLGNYILTVFVFILCSFVSNGQSKSIDSLKAIVEKHREDTNIVKALNQLSGLFIQSNNNEDGRYYADQARILSEKLNFDREKTDALQNIAYSYINQNNFSQARKYLLETAILAGHVNNIFLKAKMITLVARTYSIEENYPEALQYYYQTLAEWEKSKNDFWTATTFSDIGYVLFNQEEFQSSLKNWTRAKELFQKIGDKSQVARSYISIALIYQNQDSLNKALENYSSAQKIYEELRDKEGLFYVFQGHGDIADRQAELATPEQKMITYQSALEYYENALTLALEINDSLQMAQANAHMGRVNFRLKNFKIARKNLQASIQLGRGNKENLKSVYQYMSTLDSLEGNYKDAYQNYIKYILYRDSLVNDEGSKKSLHAKMQYEFDKKEALVKAEQEKKDEATKRTRNLQYFVIALVLIAAIFLFIYSRQKQKAKTKVEKAYSDLKATQSQLIQSEKMASLGELTAGIAHEIQNPLNFVNNFSEVNEDLLKELKTEAEKGNLEEVKAIANDIAFNSEKINHHGKRADSIVKGMLQHSRSSTGIKEPTDISALCDEYLRLAYHGLRAKDKSFNATTKTEFDNSIGKINIISQDIGRVILNLINNAFYAVSEKAKQNIAGYEPTVTVITKKIRDKVEIRVKDNGSGIPQKILDKIFQPFFTTKPTGQGTGLGLSLAYDIITKGHGGELKVETKEGEGASFIIQLPIN